VRDKILSLACLPIPSYGFKTYLFKIIIIIKVEKISIFKRKKKLNIF